MTEQIHGHLVAVNREYLGDEVAVDSGSDGQLVVGDGADFDETGGWVSIDGDLYEYTAVTDTTASGFDEPVILTLDSPPVSDITAGTAVDVWSLDDNAAVVEWIGQVLLDGQDEGDPVEAVVDHALVPLLPETIHPDGGNAVTLQWDDDELVIVTVNGKVPAATGVYIDPTTIPTQVPTTAPTQSPDLKVYGLANGVILSADPAQVEAGTVVAFHASLTSGFTPDSSTLLPDTPSAELIQVVLKMPDGSDFPLDTEVYFRTVASNVVDAAAPGVEVPGQNNGTAVAILAADVVAAQTGIIEKILTDRLTVGIGYFDATEGIVLPQPGGNTTRFTVDGITPSQIAGYVIIDGGTILDNLNAYGLTQMFGTFRLANGITDPAVKADLARTWDSLDTGLTDSDFPTIWRGLCQSISNADELITAGSFFNGTVRAVHKTTGATSPFILPTFSDFQPFGGICAIGSHYYMLGQRSSDSTWRVYKYDSTFTHVDDWHVATSFPNQPAIGTDGTKVLIAWVGSSDALRLRQYGTAGVQDSDDTLLPSGSVTTNRALGGVYRGTADFGATRTVIASNNGDIYVFNSSLTRVAADEFQRAGGSACRGLHWDGTRFRHIDGNARLWDYHTGHVQDSTTYGTYDWYDGDTSSGSSLHWTKAAPARSFSWPARSKVVVTGKPAPDVGVTDPTKLDKFNLVRIYLGPTSGTMRLQDGGGVNGALPLGETELGIESPDTGSALAPTTANTAGATISPGAVESARLATLDGEPLTDVRGDGTGRMLKIMQAGTVATGTMTAATEKSIAVTFPEPFDVAPTITLGCGFNTRPDIFHAIHDSVTTTGFTLLARRESGTASFDVHWQAIVPTS